MTKHKIIVIALAVTVGVFALASAPSAHAATNISASSSQHWAWNEVIGWLDFYSTGNITVGATSTSGYASSSAGVVSLDCNTTPSGNICSAGNGFYQVLNDGGGNLSGWAWNDTVGWISLWCGNANAGGSCVSSPYRVTIDPTGNFNGWAWNDAIGWIDFNCNNVEDYLCGASVFKVVTTWAPSSTSGTLDSATFDTGVAAGVQLNSVLWQGPSLPAQTSVSFQFAVATSSAGPWNFTGPDGTASTTWSAPNPGVPVPLSSYSQYTNFRYFRYRIILTSNSAQTATPRVDDVVVGWSP